jgi:hypothetical protein
MAELPQRASRSRYSSPFATPHNVARGVSENAERPKTFMDKWCVSLPRSSLFAFFGHTAARILN